MEEAMNLAVDECVDADYAVLTSKMAVATGEANATEALNEAVAAAAAKQKALCDLLLSAKGQEAKAKALPSKVVVFLGVAGSAQLLDAVKDGGFDVNSTIKESDLWCV